MVETNMRYDWGLNQPRIQSSCSCKNEIKNLGQTKVKLKQNRDTIKVWKGNMNFKSKLEKP